MLFGGGPLVVVSGLVGSFSWIGSNVLASRSYGACIGCNQSSRAEYRICTSILRSLECMKRTRVGWATNKMILKVNKTDTPCACVRVCVCARVCECIHTTAEETPPTEMDDRGTIATSSPDELS